MKMKIGLWKFDAPDSGGANSQFPVWPMLLDPIRWGISDRGF